MKKLQTLYGKWQSLQPLSERKRYLLSQRFSVDYNFNSNHIEGNTLTYGQTELLLLFGKVVGEGDLKDFVDMKASQVGVKMMTEEARLKDHPLTQNFIRQLHKHCLGRIILYIEIFREASRQAMLSMPVNIRHAPTVSSQDTGTGLSTLLLKKLRL